MCYYMDEPWGHHTERRKPVTKGWTLYEPTYMRFLEQPNSWRQKAEWWLSRAGWEAGWGCTVQWGQFQFWKMKGVLEMEGRDGCNNMNVLTASKLYA